jgi:CubicO group peptidase (beta-lactamase class C family)
MSRADSLGDQVDNVIEGALRRERLVGAVVMVSLDGALVYARAAGLADRERGASTQLDTIFRAASLSKPITSAAALALVERNLLSLDQPIRTWLPDFVTRTTDGRVVDINVRQLLTHTSGLDYGFGDRREEFISLGIGSGLDQVDLGMDEQLARLSRPHLNFAPGHGWKYSLATDVLGAVLEKAANQPLPALIAELVTGPLGMTSTSFSVVDPGRLATPYADGLPRPTRIVGQRDLPMLGGTLTARPPIAPEADRVSRAQWQQKQI